MHFEVVTLFPEFFESPLKSGLLGKALEDGLARVDFVDPRSFAEDRHRTVDDTPYGGGAGMVMMAHRVVPAIEQAKARLPEGSPVLLMSPQGRPVRHEDCARWSASPGLGLVAGRYEGFDERIRDFVDEEVSMGDFVLTGGEYAALAIIDAVARLRPGVIGNDQSAHTDSFAQGLLEHPHYTRPAEFRGMGVPDVLKSGDHAQIEQWRRDRSLERTLGRRPELLAEVELDGRERLVLQDAPSRAPSVELCVTLDGIQVARKYLRLAAAYGVERVYFVTSEVEALALRIDEWRKEAASRPRPPSKKASRKQRRSYELARRAAEQWQHVADNALSYGDAADAESHAADHGSRCLRVGVDGSGPIGGEVLGPRALTETARGEGLGIRLYIGGRPQVDVRMPRLRVAGRYQGIRGITEAAVVLDRLLGEG